MNEWKNFHLSWISLSRSFWTCVSIGIIRTIAFENNSTLKGLETSKLVIISIFKMFNSNIIEAVYLAFFGLLLVLWCLFFLTLILGNQNRMRHKEIKYTLTPLISKNERPTTQVAKFKRQFYTMCNASL